MVFSEFKEAFKTSLAESLRERGHKVEIVETVAHKANLDKEGLAVRLDGQNVAPTIYLASAFESYRNSEYTIEGFADKMAASVETWNDGYSDIGFDPANFNAAYIRDHAIIAVVSTELNEDFLTRVPHEEIPGTDLSAYVKVRISDQAFITITNDHLSMMQLRAPEILDIARENTLNRGFTVRSMTEVLTGMMPEGMATDGLLPMPEEDPMLVISNSTGLDGAAAIIDREILDRACEKLRCQSVVIMPSSRHELLAVNPEAMNLESTASLKEMVIQVNATQVSLEDKLSDNIYLYKSRTHELTLCNEEGIFLEADSLEISRNIGIAM